MRGLTKILAAVLILAEVFSSAESAVVIGRIVFKSGGVFSQRELRQWSKLEAGKVLSETAIDTGMKSLLTTLAEQGYYFAEVDSVTQDYSSDSSKAEITVYLQEGERLFLNSVVFEDEVDFISAEQSVKNFPRGGRIDQNRLHQAIEDCLLEGEIQGYAFYNLAIKDYRIVEERDSYKLDITFIRVPGPQVTLQGVEVTGNKITRNSYIIRETRLKAGKLFTPQALDRARTHLQQTRLFKQVKPIDILSYQDGYRALVEVEEKRFNSLDGAVGYVPGGNDTKGYWTGLMDIAFNNLFGSGRQWAIYWRQPSRNSQDLSLKYKEPWIGGLPLDASINFQQSVRALSNITGVPSGDRYLNRGLELKGYFSLSENITISGGVNQTETIPDSLSRYVAGIPHSLSRGLIAGVTIDNRDEPLNPRQGYYYSTTASVADKKNYVPPSSEIPATAGENRVTFELEAAHTVASYLTLLSRINLKYLKSPQRNLPVSELFYFGGANSMRGYREEQFYGNMVAYSNWELRWIIGKYSRIFLFNDWGYHERRTSDQSGDATLHRWWHYSYGAGVAFETEVGIFGIDYGIAEGSSPATGMFHFRLRNEF